MFTSAPAQAETASTPEVLDGVISTPAVLNEVTCTSSRAPWLADYLDKKLEWNIDEPTFGNIGFEVYDRRTDTTCHMDRTRQFGSASTVKAIIAAALMLRAQETQPDGRLPADERTLVEPMIRTSDTPAAIVLWPKVIEQRSDGTSWIQYFLDRAQMGNTVPGADGEWGTTKITAQDMTQMMRMITVPGAVLSEANSSELLTLLSEAALKYGVGDGAPPGTTTHVKIGFADLGDHWDLRVHSVGSVDGLGRDYMMALLSDGNLDTPDGFEAGKQRLGDIARIIHVGLNGLGLRNAHSGKCLDVVDGSTVPGVRVQQWDCNLNFQQGWLLRRVNVANPFWDEVTIFNVNSGKCLGVQDRSTANGAEAQQQDCHEGTSQRWRLGNPSPEGTLRIWNVKSKKCLTADPANPTDGGRVFQQSCLGTERYQQWGV